MTVQRGLAADVVDAALSRQIQEALIGKLDAVDEDMMQRELDTLMAAYNQVCTKTACRWNSLWFTCTAHVGKFTERLHIDASFSESAKCFI
jgi:hypothetical protein